MSAGSDDDDTLPGLNVTHYRQEVGEGQGKHVRRCRNHERGLGWHENIGWCEPLARGMAAWKSETGGLLERGLELSVWNGRRGEYGCKLSAKG